MDNTEKINKAFDDLDALISNLKNRLNILENKVDMLMNAHHFDGGEKFTEEDEKELWSKVYKKASDLFMDVGRYGNQFVKGIFLPENLYHIAYRHKYKENSLKIDFYTRNVFEIILKKNALKIAGMMINIELPRPIKLIDDEKALIFESISGDTISIGVYKYDKDNRAVS